MRLVDAHVHLPSYGDPEGALAGAVSDGTFLFSCTVNPREAGPNLELRRKHPQTVACFVGVHPSNVSEQLPSQALKGYFLPADGVGEIGLDEKYSSTSPGSMQMRAFTDQLAAAERLRKPVEVHSRGSAGLCLDVMSGFRLDSILMHWFEDEVLLPRVVSAGHYVSFGPAILYSKKLRRMAVSVARDRLLTESDGPVPFGVLDGASGPGLIPSVVFALSELHHTSYEDMESILAKNAERFLGRSLGPSSPQ